MRGVPARSRAGLRSWYRVGRVGPARHARWGIDTLPRTRYPLIESKCRDHLAIAFWASENGCFPAAPPGAQCAPGAHHSSPPPGERNGLGEAAVPSRIAVHGDHHVRSQSVIRLSGRVPGISRGPSPFSLSVLDAATDSGLGGRRRISTMELRVLELSTGSKWRCDAADAIIAGGAGIGRSLVPDQCFAGHSAAAGDAA